MLRIPLSASAFVHYLSLFTHGGGEMIVNSFEKAIVFSLFPCLLMYDRDKRVKSFTSTANGKRHIQVENFSK